MYSSKKAVSKIYALIIAVIIIVALSGGYFYFSNPSHSSTTPEVNSITVNGVQLQILNATKQETYQVAGVTYTSSYGYFLIVKAHLLSGDMEQPNNWNVTVHDQEGHIMMCDFAFLTNTTLSKGFDYTQTWVFDTLHTATSYNLYLYDQLHTVNLDSLID